MSTKIGRFEILGELAKSDSGCVYKANDPESGQTLALKVIRLDVFGEHAEQVVQRILQEAETTKDLSSSNITLVYGAGEIDGQFCAAMEYIQGNSIATMLARKEGFSIWDLLDISRQVCQALDHAHEHNVFHFSLEPAKVMVTCEVTVFGLGSHSATGEEWADDDNAVTSAEAQSFKRACACLGLGRYLYYFTGTWVDLDEHKRPKSVPQLAGWATPAGWLEGLRPRCACEQEGSKAAIAGNGSNAQGNRIAARSEQRRLR